MSKKIEQFMAVIVAALAELNVVSTGSAVSSAALYFDGEYTRTDDGTCVYVQPADLTFSIMEEVNGWVSVHVAHKTANWIHMTLDCVKTKPSKFAVLKVDGNQVAINNHTDLHSLIYEGNVLSVIKQHLPKLWEREMYNHDADLSMSDIAPAVNVVPDEYCEPMDDFLTVDGMEIATGWPDAEYVFPRRERVMEVTTYNESASFGGYSIHQGWMYNGAGYVPFFSASSVKGGWSVRVVRIIESIDRDGDDYVMRKNGFKHCGKCDYDGDSCHGKPLWDDEA